MSSTEPLLLVLAVLALLWFVGAQLNKLNATTGSQPTARGEQITPYLHVTGLQDYQLEELKAIVQHGDESTLTKFIAYYRPALLELDSYIQQLRMRFLDNLGKPPESATDIEKIAAANRLLLNDSPEPYDFNQLSKSEVRILLEHGEHKGRHVNDEFVQRFGDAQFVENFSAYKQLLRNQPYTLYVPKRDPNRPLLDLLAKTGVVSKGRRVQLQDRLRIMPLAQLNDMARELKIGKIFQSHEHAVEALAKVPGSAILLAMVHSIDDLFFLDPNAINVAAIEHELSVWSVFAKLISRPAKQASPNPVLRRSV